MSKYQAKEPPLLMAHESPLCPHCRSSIVVVGGNMYRQCKCGEWRNDPLLGWEYIPIGAEHSGYINTDKEK